jgi:hypothetical protein
VAYIGSGLPFKAYKICGTAMSPPKLSRDAPVLDATQPGIPFGFGRFWVYGELSRFSSLVHVLEVYYSGNRAYDKSLLGQDFAIDPPLRLENGLDDILGFPIFVNGM